MSTGQPKRRRVRSPRQVRREMEEEELTREITPTERRRQMVIHIGVGVLLFAFLTTSGITCNVMKYQNKQQQQQQAAESEHVDPTTVEIDRYRKELEKNPNDSGTLCNLAFYLIEKSIGAGAEEAKKLQDEAEAKLAAAIKLDPDYPFAHLQMSRVKGIQKKPEESYAEAETALKAAMKPIDPNDKEKTAKEGAARGFQYEARVALAKAAFEKKNLDETVNQLSEAIKVDPGHYESYMMRASVYGKQGQKELARKDLETAKKVAEQLGDPYSKMRVDMQVAQLLYELDPTAAPPPGMNVPMPAASGVPETPASTPAASGTPVPLPTASETPAASASPAAPEGSPSPVLPTPGAPTAQPTP